MNIGRAVGAAGTVLALTIGITQSATAEPKSATGHAAGTRSVTLITGDRVFLTGRETLAIRPAAGRERTTFSTYTDDGHRYLVPADATRLITAGRIDRRLFDLTTLLESGYDDASRGSLPLIITYEGTTGARAAVAGGTVTRELPSINGAAVSVDKRTATAMWNAVTAGGAPARAAAGIRKVWLDGVRRSTLDRSVPQIGAPAAWAAGWTGTGVKIAVLDTGVDQTHPDLAGGKEVAEQNFSDAPDNVDRFGHGTHVASIAAGSGAKAGGKYKGVAPGASILDGKVLNDGGGGQESWIVAGMEWAAAQGAKVANLSLGTSDTPEIDPLEEAVNTISAQHGILFVIAAGNSGPSAETVGSPGSADAALTVGAVDRNDAIAEFSSRGPRIGDGAIKPDITAPGVGIVAAKAANADLGPPVEDGYVAASGTSMATPHVAGSVALLAQQHPDWTGAQLKAVLTASAKPNAGLGVFDQGSGRVDVAKAINQAVASEPTNVSLGVVQWPHDDDQPVSKPLTYHNLGGTDVTLTLAVEARGPDGRPAPTGVLSLSANQITVPAGGTAQVGLTGDTRVATVDGVYTGTVVATAGTAAVITPVTITREVESYTVTIHVRDPAGAPTGEYDLLVLGLDDGRVRSAYDPDGSVAVRLPKGRHLVDTTVITTAPDGTPHFHRLAGPAITVDRDTTLEVAAAAARPVAITLPEPANLALAQVTYEARTPLGSVPVGLFTTDLSTVSTAWIGPPLPADALIATLNTHWLAASGAFYGLAWFEFGAVPTGFTKVIRQRDLATVRAELGSVTPNSTGLRGARPQPVNADAFAVGVLADVPLPSNRTEYYNTGVEWQTALFLVDESGGLQGTLFSEFQQFRAGRTEHLRFNHAVFGPAFPRADFPAAARIGDEMGISVPMFSDSSGNAGNSVVESASSKLFRNGALIGESPAPGGGIFAVPPEAADYRLTTDVVRPPIFDVSTKISAAWTFRSGHVDGSGPAALPLSAIRFTPRLDETNSAPAGRAFLVPVRLQLQSGDQVRPRRLNVAVSYDEGRTWRRAPVLANLAVLLHHPADATSVSLRASAADRDGNTVEQTIIRAYKLAER